MNRVKKAVFVGAVIASGACLGIRSAGATIDRALSAVKATHAHIAEASEEHSTGRKHVTPLTMGEAVDAEACKSIANDMREAASGDVTKSEARSFANAANNALKKDKRAPKLKKLARAGEVFVRAFAERPLNPVSLALVQDCATSGIEAPLIPAAVTTTTSSVPSQASCSSTALFSLVAHAEPGLSATYVPSQNGPISAYCSGGWAVLNNFTIQEGSGNGIALFQQKGNGWTFIQVGDDSGGDGPDCDQYPAAALQALGTQLCNSSSSTTTTAPQLTPEQQFAQDAISEIPAVQSAVNTGLVSGTNLGSDGDTICNDFLYPPNNDEEGAYGQAVDFAEGLWKTNIPDPVDPGLDYSALSQADAESVVSLAIDDICSQYQSYIPYGDPGAS